MVLTPFWHERQRPGQNDMAFPWLKTQSLEPRWVQQRYDRQHGITGTPGADDISDSNMLIAAWRSCRMRGQWSGEEKTCHLVHWSQTRAQGRRSCDGGDDVVIHGSRGCHCIESMKIVYLRILRHSCKYECGNKCSGKNAPDAKPVMQNSGQNQRQMRRKIGQNKGNRAQSNGQTAGSRGKTPGAIRPAEIAVQVPVQGAAPKQESAMVAPATTKGRRYLASELQDGDSVEKARKVCRNEEKVLTSCFKSSNS